MIYINLSDTEVSVIQTSKPFLAPEKIISSARKELPVGVVSEGVVIDGAKLVSIIREIFENSYPKRIADQNYSLAISDSQIITQRINLEENFNPKDLPNKIADKVRKKITDDLESLVNFYQPINTSSESQEILYTAVLKSTLLLYEETLRPLGLNLNFLSGRSFALHEFFKPIIGKNEVILFCDLDKDKSQFFLFDSFGLLEFIEEKRVSKTITAKLNFLQDKWGKEKNLPINKIIIGGYGSIDYQIEDLLQENKQQIFKLADLMSQLMSVHKITFNSGGLPQMLFVASLGTILLANSKSPPNFASDLKSLKQVYIPEKTSLDQKADTAAFQKSVSAQDSQILSGQITEHRRVNFSQIFSNKLLLLFVSIIFGFFFIMASFAFFSRQTNFQIPFLLKPTSTPVPTVSPTLTPTPTIDVSLKPKDLKVSVQNGTDRTGYAKEIAEYLEGKEYKNISKSNADTDNYEESIIKIKKSKEKYLPLIQRDLQEKITTANIESLDEENKFDVVVILGKK